MVTRHPRRPAGLHRARPSGASIPTGGQTTSEVAICERGLDDLYIVLGEPREQPGGGAQLGAARLLTTPGRG